MLTWNGRKTEKVTGVLHLFVPPERVEPAVGFYSKVQLLSSKGRWWLYYGRTLNPNGKPNYKKHSHATGSFQSRQEAVKWFNGKGR